MVERIVGMKRQQLLNFIDWVLPPKIFQLLTYYRPAALWFALAHHNVLRANKALFNRHRGERCFVLCNGPSVKQQDIRPLKNEVVFSVSSGYLHPDYPDIRPRYHCIPQLTYGKISPEVAANWFREMDRNLEGAELFLDLQEWTLVQEQSLFSGRDVHFVCMGRNYFPRAPANIEELAGIMPRVQTVPILVIMIAMYMGFREIYLVGTDHDWFVKQEYKYFYEPGLLKGLDFGVRQDGTLETTLWDELPTVGKVWAQYRAVKGIAKAHGVTIFNATHGGMLDEFERVCLEDILKK
jgi:hypothetical protein